MGGKRGRRGLQVSFGGRRLALDSLWHTRGFSRERRGLPWASRLSVLPQCWDRLLFPCLWPSWAKAWCGENTACVSLRRWVSGVLGTGRFQGRWRHLCYVNNWKSTIWYSREKQRLFLQKKNGVGAQSGDAARLYLMWQHDDSVEDWIKLTCAVVALTSGYQSFQTLRSISVGSVVETIGFQRREVFGPVLWLSVKTCLPRWTSIILK